MELAEIVYKELKIKGELSFLEYERIINLNPNYGLKKVLWYAGDELLLKGVIFDKDEKGHTILKLK